MEFIKEASEYLQDKDYLTPYEKSVIFARLQIMEFCSFETCKVWIAETITDLLQSDNPHQEIKDARARL